MRFVVCSLLLPIALALFLLAVDVHARNGGIQFALWGVVTLWLLGGGAICFIRVCAAVLRAAWGR
jgi:hypothetical protein